MPDPLIYDTSNQLRRGLQSQGQSEADILNTPMGKFPSDDDPNAHTMPVDVPGTGDTDASGELAPWEAGPGQPGVAPPKPQDIAYHPHDAMIAARLAGHSWQAINQFMQQNGISAGGHPGDLDYRLRAHTLRGMAQPPMVSNSELNQVFERANPDADNAMSRSPPDIGDTYQMYNPDDGERRMPPGGRDI